MSGEVSASRRIAAAPEVVWKLVSDITRVGEWSPEATGGRWLGGATGPAVGARFRGSNRNGRRRWSTTCTVTAAEPARSFAFAVSAYGIPVAEWSYDIEPDGDGARVTERFVDRRPGWFRTPGGIVTGVADREAANRRNIETTLERLESVATGVL